MTGAATFLWYRHGAVEAARFYASIFPGAEIVNESASSATFRLSGQEYIAFNGGETFAFTPAISIFVKCDTQAEIDRYWEALSQGGETGRCGWLTDRWGLSWQIVPVRLGELLSSEDAAAAGRTMAAMLSMERLDIAALQAAHDGGATGSGE
jgi:predicted 3-demethylubiquinone-9 3-methyltransferase (glyoxalase superfamily)